MSLFSHLAGALGKLLPASRPIGNSKRIKKREFLPVCRSQQGETIDSPDALHIQTVIFQRGDPIDESTRLLLPNARKSKSNTFVNTFFTFFRFFSFCGGRILLFGLFLAVWRGFHGLFCVFRVWILGKFWSEVGFWFRRVGGTAHVLGVLRGIKQGWLAGGGEQLEVEEFGKGGGELDGEGDFVGLDVDDGEAAKGLLAAAFQFVGEAKAGKGSVAAGLGEADDGELVVEGESTQEARAEGNRLEVAVCWIDVSEFAGAGVEDPEAVVVKSWRVRHGEAVQDNFVVGDVDEHSSVAAVLAPAFGFVGRADCGGVSGGDAFGGEAVEVTAVFGR